jgi:hypothetical protein
VALGLEEFQEFFTDFGGFHGSGGVGDKGWILREKGEKARSGPDV